MKGKLTEAEKNFIVCGILMLCVGIGMLLLRKTITMAIVIICISVIFFIVPIVMYAKGDRIYDEPSSQNKEKSE